MEHGREERARVHSLRNLNHSRPPGQPCTCIRVGDDEVLLDDSQLFLRRAVSAGVDVRLDLCMGMPHGFVINVGKLKAAGLALNVVSAFLFDKLNDPAISR